MNQPSAPSYFSGNDRIEFAPILGRPIRMGAAVAEGFSDTARMRQLLAANNAVEALNFAKLLHALNTAVVATFLEWCFALPKHMLQNSDAATERATTMRAFTLWEEGLAAYTPESVSLLKALLSPTDLTTHAIDTFREAARMGRTTSAGELLELPGKTMRAIEAALNTADGAAAKQLWEQYVLQIRERHDLCGEFVSSVASVAAEKIGQSNALLVMQHALESCPLLEELWKAAAVLDAASLAAILAEHLRNHFSGADRAGSVRVVEETDRFRLIFAPCGTGGAMRLRNVPGLKILKEATPSTWHFAEMVPSYCAHCAHNELTSLERFGQLAWVTEFDPDPTKPCGWTVYKDRTLVPARYVSRLKGR